MKLDALLSPRSVAVLGASPAPGDLGHRVARNLCTGGYAGELVLVHPQGGEIEGRPVATELDRAVDLAVVASPAGEVRAAVEAALAAGVQAIQVNTPLERRVGSEQGELEGELLAACRARGVRLLGPSSLGVVHRALGLNATFVEHLPPAGGIAVVSQSSALAAAILDWTASRGVGLSCLVALGNKLDVDEIDVFERLIEDADTRVVIGYLEYIRAGREFLKVAEALSSVKPVVLLKTGSTGAGARASAAHLGETPATDLAYGAAFKRSGVVRADSFQMLLDSARALAGQPLPSGPRMAVVTNAGGPGIMAADALEEHGMSLATLGEGTLAALREVLPPEAGLENPVDVLGDADPVRFAEAARRVQADPGVDGLVVVLAPQAATRPAETARALVAGLDRAKPVLAAFMGGREVVEARQVLVAAGLPDFPAPHRAARSLGALSEYATWRRRPPRVVTRYPVNRRRVERILRRVEREGRTDVEEFMAKEVLAAYDFSIPAGQLVQTADEAVEAAERLGYPVVLKIVSPDIVQKSSVGGVRLGLVNPDQVSDGFDLIMLRIQKQRPDAHLEGLVVEKMCPRGLEVVVGMTRDPEFGPLLMFGLGGIAVEVMEDVAFYLAPITEDEALQMLKSTRSFQTIEARKAREGMDVGAIAGALQRLSQLATDFPQVREVEVSPFIVGRPGRESMVADARLVIARGVAP